MGLHADELCVTELAQVIWAVQMSTVEFHPWNSRRADVEHPDEWRIDLDPDAASARSTPFAGSPVSSTRCSTNSARSAGRRLREVAGCTSTSAFQPSHGFTDVRRAALAFAREVERRCPADSTTTWWRKDRDPTAVFIDYNQNARDHTMAAAYSVRGFPDGRVSAPMEWGEIASVEPADLTVLTMPDRFARLGDLHAAIDQHVFSIEPLLEWAARDDRDGALEPPPPETDDTPERLTPPAPHAMPQLSNAIADPLLPRVG